MRIPRFTVYRDRQGQWRWRLQATNNRIIGTGGEPYSRRADALRAVRRVRASIGIAAVRVLAVVLLLVLAPGCVSRTIYVADGEPVRLRETVRRAKVWVLDADGRPTAGVMDLPSGWYCLPDEMEE